MTTLAPILDLYTLFDVAPDATVQEIEAAFRALALRFHPDRNADPRATGWMALLIRAREVLLDPALRGVHDARTVARPMVRTGPMPSPGFDYALPKSARVRGLQPTTRHGRVHGQRSWRYPNE